jgi:hypothetical protein
MVSDVHLFQYKGCSNEMQLHAWPPQESNKGLYVMVGRGYEGRSGAVIPVAAQAVLCRGDSSSGALVEWVPACLPQCPMSMETGFDGLAPSPMRILGRVSFEQPSFLQGMSVNPSPTTYSPVMS